MNHNPSTNLFKQLWVAAVFGMCAWSASPFTAQAQGESLNNACVQNVDQWIIEKAAQSSTPSESEGGVGDSGGSKGRSGGVGDSGGSKGRSDGGVGDSGGSKGRISTIVRNVSVPGGARQQLVSTTQITTHYDAFNRITRQLTTKDEANSELLNCEYDEQPDGTIKVAVSSRRLNDKQEIESLAFVDREKRTVRYGDERLSRVQLGYDASSSDALTPKLFEQKVYEWAVTRFTNSMSGAGPRDGLARVFYKSEDDLAADQDGRTYYQTVYFRKDPATRLGAIRKVEMCFASDWSKCVSSSANPPSRYITYFKPAASKRKGTTAIASWTDEVSYGRSGKVETRLRSELIELEGVQFRVVND